MTRKQEYVMNEKFDRKGYMLSTYGQSGIVVRKEDCWDLQAIVMFNEPEKVTLRTARYSSGKYPGYINVEIDFNELKALKEFTEKVVCKHMKIGALIK